MGVQQMLAFESCPALCLSELSAAQLRCKRVLLRCDLNCPLDSGNITDDTRIREAVPSIKYLTSSGACVLLCSHLGRPKGVEDALRLSVVAPSLARALGQQVILANNCIGGDVTKKAAALREGQVLLLENTRFHAGECKNDPAFAQQLAANADIYVNDAFGCAHRAHASTAGVTQFLKPAVAGLLMRKELEFLCKVVTSPKRPFAAIVGGSKVSTKISVLESLLGKCDKLLIGGGMVFTFLAARGHSVGSSLFEADKVETARALEAAAEARGVQLLLPSDVIVADSFSPNAAARVVPAVAIPDGWMGLDIGPETVATFKAALAGCQCVLWNGPMGVFEFDRFAHGTVAIARAVADLTPQGATTIIGGGDSVAAVEKAGVTAAMSHISTGGGASLELLEGRVLPGVAALTPRPTIPAGMLVAQYLYHVACNAAFQLLGPLLHRESAQAGTNEDSSISGSSHISSLTRSASRCQLASI